ncbi:MAG: hypothetical protein KF734_11830 [Saprospiraceae bacterium]|nr:hypothetical protein [Saprospiraceae bacterium]
MTPQACLSINPEIYSIPNSTDANLVWTLSTNPPNIGQFVSPPSGEFVAIDWNNAGTAQLCATPTNPCYGNNPICLDISISPYPVMDYVSDITVCLGEQVSVTFNGPPGQTYEWTASNQFTGIPPSGSGDIFFIAAEVFVPTTSIILVFPYVGACRGAGKVFYITVLPTPSANAPPPVTACAGAPVSVALSGSPGATFAWENPNPAIGLPTNGTGNISFTAASVAQQEFANITVTPLYTLGAVSCPGPSVTLTVTVNPAPTTDDPPDVSVCAGRSAVAVQPAVPGAAFNWTNNNPAVGLLPAGTGNIAFTAANVAATQTATVTVTASALGLPRPTADPRHHRQAKAQRRTTAQHRRLRRRPRRRQLLRLPRRHLQLDEQQPNRRPATRRNRKHRGHRRPRHPDRDGHRHLCPRARRLRRPAPNLPRHRQPTAPHAGPRRCHFLRRRAGPRRLRRAARNQLPVGQRQPLHWTATRRNRLPHRLHRDPVARAADGQHHRHPRRPRLRRPATNLLRHRRRHPNPQPAAQRHRLRRRAHRRHLLWLPRRRLPLDEQQPRRRPAPSRNREHRRNRRNRHRHPLGHPHRHPSIATGMPRPAAHPCRHGREMLRHLRRNPRHGRPQRLRNRHTRRRPARKPRPRAGRHPPPHPVHQPPRPHGQHRPVLRLAPLPLPARRHAPDSLLRGRHRGKPLLQTSSINAAAPCFSLAKGPVARWRPRPAIAVGSPPEAVCRDGCADVLFALTGTPPFGFEWLVEQGGQTLLWRQETTDAHELTVTVCPSDFALPGEHGYLNFRVRNLVDRFCGCE